MAKGKRNIKGTVCGILCMVFYLLMLGIVGGVQCETIALKEAILPAAICAIVFFASAVVGDFID